MEYNDAMVEALEREGVEVIAITDHYRVKTTQGLAEAARARGICVFPGFEAVTKEGVHLLCLFDPGEDLDRIDRFLGECGIHDDDEASPTGTLDVHELLNKCATSWKGICVAAHVCSSGGLLTTLRGQPASKAWRHDELHACSLPGPVVDAPAAQRPILLNRNPDYRRARPIAVINAQDVSDPSDVDKPGSSCWIKMAGVSLEGLRQAFLDPDSRIRLASDEVPDEHTELLSISWEGGFLDGTAIHLNENLNVLIGGRGTGKSTIVESIRYALGCQCLGKDAAALHASFVKHVLGSGTKVSLVVRSHRPSPRDYLVGRTVPNPPTVRDRDGELTELSPQDIAPEVEVYGQHEISELAKSPESLTGLLDRFVETSTGPDGERSRILNSLEDNRTRTVELGKTLRRIDTELAELPALQEKLKRYRDVGLEERLSDKNQLVTEEAILNKADSLVSGVSDGARDADGAFTLDLSRLSEESLKDLGGREILATARSVLETLEGEAKAALTSVGTAVKTARSELEKVRSDWNNRREELDASYEKTLRELQKEGVDGAEFIKVRERIEELNPKRDERKRAEAQLAAAQLGRRETLQEWEDLKAQQFRELERAAKRVNRRLKDRVQVEVQATGDRSQLDAHIRSLGGRVADTIQALQARSPLSLLDLAQACREGKDALVERFEIPAGQAERMADAGPGFAMQLEELELAATTTIQLNVAREGASPTWRRLDQLSTGQKATAVLLLLLLESRGPLVVDQPEDDLDNRFITEGIVPKIREEKRRRQFIFATHNANMPVLGDAELIAALVPTQGDETPEVHLPDENLGSIDSPEVRELVEETLEGGRAAFEMRRLKYGF